MYKLNTPVDSLENFAYAPVNSLRETLYHSIRAPRNFVDDDIQKNVTVELNRVSPKEPQGGESRLCNCAITCTELKEMYVERY